MWQEKDILSKIRITHASSMIGHDVVVKMMM